MNRKQFLEIVENKENDTFGFYTLLKECIETDDNIHEIDRWFKGVVLSVTKYTPNTTLLSFVGKPATGKSHFFANILPLGLDIGYLHTLSLTGMFLYDRAIVEVEMRSGVFDAVKNYNVKFLDKRLASYVTTANSWQYPQKKSAVVINVKSINWELYNSIDKTKLWIEIFKIFKP